MADDDAGWGMRARTRVVGRFLFYFLGGFALFTLDPFGFDRITDYYSERIIQLAFSPFYESGTPVWNDGRDAAWLHPPDERGEGSAVTVVMLDKSTTEQLELPWPIPYKNHGILLDRVLKSCPRALFIDFRFLRVHREGEVRHLERVLLNFFGVEGTEEASPWERLAEAPPGGIAPGRLSGAHECESQIASGALDLPPGHFRAGTFPLFFAHADELDTPLIGRLGLFGRALPTRFVTAGRVSDYHGGYPLALSFAEKAGDTKESEEGDDDVATPAVALYRVFRGVPAAQAIEPPDPDDFLGKMYLRWGYWMSPRQPDYRDGMVGCETRCGMTGVAGGILPVLKSVELLVGSLVSGARGRDEANALYCPPILEIPAQLPMHIGTPPDAYRDDLRGRLVLYGGNLSQTPDLAFSPVQGPIPGVYVHAMALDNLLTMGPKGYATRLSEGWSRAIELVLLAILAFFAVRRKETRDDTYVEQAAEPWQADRTDLFLFFRAVGLSLLIAVAGISVSFIGQFAPANFIGLLAASGVIGVLQSSGLFHCVRWVARKLDRRVFDSRD
ncbi:CHASE2 domain-containing protein [Marivibrio halodurans]|uniref:CHASE2 domain-containing protein n=1 Tax=Marivibrio halodurans TaxID=2039722 RepID=A0A8J7SBH6_9PROT|nr:CHASE2 domain-containing protein [Marivibrio halodurans]MBP5858967.1 CHASE2 domain-containing protein [Marivibrio halodurans]